MKSDAKNQSKYNLTTGESDKLVWMEIDAGARIKSCAGARGLSNFINSAEVVECVTEKHHPDTNIIDQGRGRTYFFSTQQIQELFIHLEAARLEGTITHFSERQGTQKNLQNRKHTDDVD